MKRQKCNNKQSGLYSLHPALVVKTKDYYPGPEN